MAAGRIGMLICLCLSLGACASSTVSEHPDAPLKIRIQWLPDSGLWEAEYQFPETQRALRFEASQYDRSAWQLLSPGVAWVRDGDEMVIRARRGKKMSRLRIGLPVDLRTYAKQYAGFKQFGDGALLVYTGQLQPASKLLDGRPTSYEFLPRAGETAIANGQQSGGAIRWQSRDTIGTYAYTGHAVPAANDSLLAVLDQQLPDWQRRAFEQTMPAVFASLGATLGPAPQGRPTVFLSYRQSLQSGRFLDGGTLPGVLQAETSGNAWRQESDEARAEFLLLLAHEAAHIWNQNWKLPDVSDAWLHEGSADALAWAALYEAAQVDKAMVSAAISRKLNLCIHASQQMAVADAGTRGEFRSLYDCGFLISLAQGGELRPDAPLSGTLALWRKLTHRAAGAGFVPTRAAYEQALASAGVSAAGLARHATLINTRLADPVKSWTDLLADQGFSLKPASTPPAYAELDAMLLRSLLATLMSADCKGWYSMKLDLDRVDTAANSRCTIFRSPRTVTEIMGLPLTRAVEVYDLAQAQCARGADVTLAGPDIRRELRVFCDASLPRRAPWFKVSYAG